jgi:hypothetical protein
VPIYVVSIAALQNSVQCYQLPFKEKLETLYPLDNANVFEKPEDWAPLTSIYTNCPKCGASLSATTYAYPESTNRHLVFFCNSQDIFWIGVERCTGPGTLYGPYQGKLWRQANGINSTALTTVTLSSIAIVTPLIYLLLIKPRISAKPRESLKALAAFA